MQPNVSSPIVGVGELLWDLLPSGPRLGGTTTNFSILSARLGNRAALVSCLGHDRFGEEAIKLLQAVEPAGQVHGDFDLSHLQWSDRLPTGTVTVSLNEQRGPHYIIDGPVAWDEIALNPPLLELAGRASAVCFGTLAQRDTGSRETIRAMVQATSNECARVCDVNLRMPFCTAETLRWCVEHATVLKVSDEELLEVGRLLGIGLDTPHDGDAGAWALTAARSLLDYAPQCHMVAITLGSQGSLLATRTSHDRHAGFKVIVVDTIGAGDAFTTGLVHSYLRGASLQQINVVSNRCGSFVASQPGATPEVSQSLLDEIQQALS